MAGRVAGNVETFSSQWLSIGVGRGKNGNHPVLFASVQFESWQMMEAIFGGPTTFDQHLAFSWLARLFSAQDRSGPQFVGPVDHLSTQLNLHQVV